jgi:hypothetical protein
MQCSTARRLGYDDLRSDLRVCERAPRALAAGDVFVNVLRDTLPECDRVGGGERTLSPRAVLTRGDGDAPETPRRHGTCYVYCAQRSCGAARTFLHDHAEALASRCSDVVYLRNGALSMVPSSLSDGKRCHDKVRAHSVEVDAGCLTCGSESTPVRVHVNGARVRGSTYRSTSSGTPSWYRRADLWSPMPAQFHRDPKYANPPQPHAPEGATDVRLHTSGTDLADDALVAFWAAQPSGEVREAHEAYGKFTNSGITQCDRGVCRMRLKGAPGKYTTEGKVFKPHVHLSEWKGDHWGAVKTVTL